MKKRGISNAVSVLIQIDGSPRARPQTFRYKMRYHDCGIENATNLIGLMNDIGIYPRHRERFRIVIYRTKRKLPSYS